MRDGIHVRYTGDGVREVKGLGVFQRGTVAWAPREVAMRLLGEPCFEAASDGKPVRGVVLRIGQKPSNGENPPMARSGDLPDVAPEDPSTSRADARCAQDERGVFDKAAETNEGP